MMMNDDYSARFNYYSICSVQELIDAGRIVFEIDTIGMILFHVDGDFFATSNRCSHEDYSFDEEAELDGFHLICPHHGARFDIRNGDALSMPAVEKIDTYPVLVNNGMIEVGIPG